MAETTAPRTGDRRKLVVAVTAGVAALAALVWLITGQTVAGFTATTRNTGNSFEAGEVTISDSQGGTAMFTIDELLLPGQSLVKTIEVLNDVDVPLDVKLYASGAAVEKKWDEATSTYVDASTALAENLNLTVELVTADGADTVVSGETIHSFGTKLDWDSGFSSADGGDALAASPDPADKSKLLYRITVQLDPLAGIDGRDVEPKYQAVIGFTWEGRA